MGVPVGGTDGRTRWWTCQWGIRSASGAVTAADRCGGRSPAALASCTSGGWRRGLAVVPVPLSDGYCDGAPAEGPLFFSFCAPVGTLPTFGVVPSVRHDSSNVWGLGPSRVGWGCTRGGALPRAGDLRRRSRLVVATARPAADGGCVVWGERARTRRGRVDGCCSVLPFGVPLRWGRRRRGGGHGGGGHPFVLYRLWRVRASRRAPELRLVPHPETLGCWAPGRSPSSPPSPGDAFPRGMVGWLPPSPSGHRDSGRHPHPPWYRTAGRCRRLPISIDIAIGGMAVRAGRSCHGTVPMWARKAAGRACTHATRTDSLTALAFNRLLLLF